MKYLPSFLITAILFLLINPEKIRAQFELIETPAASHIADIHCFEHFCLVSDNSNTLLKTYDAGVNFIQLNSPVESGENKFDLVSIDSNTYFFQGFFGLSPSYVRVHKSIDGGYTWTKLLDTIGTYYSFDMFDEQKGILVGTFGKILQTSDGWETKSLQTNTTSLFFEVKMVNENAIFIGRYGGVTKSTDGGVSWSNATSLGQTIPNSIYSYSDDLLFVTANNNTGQKILKRSTDGGTTWSTLISGGNSYLYGIEFINENEGYITGYNYIEKQGALLYTFDGGDTWNEILSGYDKKLYEVEQANDSILLIGGEDGLLLRFNRNQPLTGSREVFQKNNPMEVYPNPAALVMNINISTKMGVATPAQLTVRNLLGQSCYLENFTLGNAQTGLEIDVSAWPPGLYLLTLESGDQHWTEKVIIHN